MPPQVTLRASLGTLNTLADVPNSVVQGRGQKQLTISTGDRTLLKFILQHVTYTSTVYQLRKVDMGESQSSDCRYSPCAPHSKPKHSPSYLQHPVVPPVATDPVEGLESRP